MNKGKEMKVGLNATSLLSPLTGIGQYTYQLAKGLQKFKDLELEYVLCQRLEH